MKNFGIKKHRSEKMNKGAPSGLVISLIFHGAAFFIAGIFVVFTVLPKPKPLFEAPPVAERPKMNLKKPKVKIKKSSSPKPSSRIVANVKMAKMPEISIPDLIGTGDGLLGGLGGTGDGLSGFADGGNITLFGGEVTTGADMEVTFYSFARRWDGRINAGMTYQEYYDIVRKFVKSGWDKRILSRSILRRKNYMRPRSSSRLRRPRWARSIWRKHGLRLLLGRPYEGKLVHKDGITFRFWGAADDVLTVSVDDKVVLAANFYGRGPNWPRSLLRMTGVSHAPDNRIHRLNNQRRTGGDWITLEPGVPVDFKAIIGEGPGGEFAAGLLVEVKGEEYPLNKNGAPIFPVFAMDNLTWEQQDAILLNMIDGEANVTNVTTVFKDH